MKKTISILIAAIMLIACLPAVSLAANEPIVLKLWGGVPAEYGPQQTVDAFNEAYKDKGIQAEYVRFVNDTTGNLKLETTLLAGGEVDLFITYTLANIAKRSEAGMMLEMSQQLADYGFDIGAELGDMGLASVNEDGKVYALPTKVELCYLMANADMFAEAGIDLPYDGWDFEEFREACKKLTHGEGDDKVYGMFWNDSKTLLYQGRPIQYVLGDDWYYTEDGLCNFNNEEFRKAYQLAYDMEFVDGTVVPYEDAVTQSLGNENTFLAGKSAMTYGIWSIRAVKDLESYPHDFVTAFVPMPVSNKEAAIYQPLDSAVGDYLSISSNTKYPQEALEFLIWYIRGGMMPMLPYGRIPIHTSISAEAKTAGYLEGPEGVLNEESILKFMEAHSKGIPSLSSKTDHKSEMEKVLQEELEAVFTRRQDVDTALNNATERCNKILQEN